MKLNLRLLYLYLFSLVGLLVFVIGAVRAIDLGLRVFVFKEADRYIFVSPPSVYEEGGKISSEEAKLRQETDLKNQENNTKRERQREAAGAIAMLLVGFPLYKYHWGLIQKENKKN